MQRMTSRILSSSKYNLWKNSLDTIDWFINIKNKKRFTFIQFDIIEFYLRIVTKSLNHVWEYTDITACRKSILSDNRRTWVKSHVDNFDVPMGAYDSVQIADLIRIYIFDTLGRIVNWELVGLYQDDSIIFIPDSNGYKTSKIQ